MFESVATDLTATPDDNGGGFFGTDVFVHDRVTGTTELISINSAGDASGNSGSSRAQISADGRVVVFESFASDLDPLDTNGTQDVFAGANPFADDPPTSNNCADLFAESPLETLEDIENARCAGVFQVSSLADLNAYIASDFGRDGGTKFQHLKVLADLTANPLEVVSPCKITLNKEVSLTGDEVLVDGYQGVNNSKELTIDATTACLRSDTNKVRLGNNSIVNAESLVIQAAKNAQLGNTVMLNVTELDITSDNGKASLGKDAAVTADSADITGKIASIGKDANVTVTNNLHIQASADNKCKINDSAVLNFGTSSGNCLP